MACNGCRCQRAIDAAIAELTAVEDSHEIGAPGEPPFLNSWVNFDSGFDTAAFYLDRERVYLQGVIGGGASGTVAFTLPAGYRPAAKALLASSSQTSGDAADATVDSSGTVTIALIAGGTLGLFSLDGLSFRVA